MSEDTQPAVELEVLSARESEAPWEADAPRPESVLSGGLSDDVGHERRAPPRAARAALAASFAPRIATRSSAVNERPSTALGARDIAGGRT